MPDLSQSNWSETDGGNNNAAPNGFPEGMAPSGVNDSARQVMGATKRFWDRINGTLNSSGAANTYSLGYTVAPTANVHGERFTFIAHQANTAGATFNSGAGAAPIRRFGQGGLETLTSSDILAGMPVEVMFDSSNSVFLMLTAPSPTIFQQLQSLSSTISVIAANLAALAIGSASFAAALNALSQSVSELRADVNKLSLSVSALNAIVAQGIIDINAISNTISVIAVAFPDADRSLSNVLGNRIVSVASTADANAVAANTSLQASLLNSISNASASVSAIAAAANISLNASVISNIGSVSTVIEARVNLLSQTFQAQLNALATGSGSALADIARLSLSVSALNSAVASLGAQGNVLSNTVSNLWARFASVTAAVELRLNDLSNTISTIVASKIPSVSFVLNSRINSVNSTVATDINAADRSTSFAIYQQIVGGAGSDFRSLSSVINAQINSASATVAGRLNALSNSISTVKAGVAALSQTVSLINANAVFGQGLIRAGSAVVNTSLTTINGVAGGLGIVSFSAAFVATLNSVVITNGDPVSAPGADGNDVFSVIFNSAGLSGFPVFVAGGGGGSVRVNYIAFGDHLL